MKALFPHPLADIFPLMSEQEFLSLKDDIKENGLRHPVLIHEGKILDGRHRYKACLELKVPFKTEVVTEKAVDRVISENINRRHLTIAQRAMISLELYDSLKVKSLSDRSRNPTPQSYEERRGRLTADKVAKVFGVSFQTILRAVSVRKHVPHLIPKIMSGEMAINTALKMIERKNKLPVSDKTAVSILRQFDSCDLTLPTGCDSYEKIINEFANKLNDAGYKMQWVFSGRKKHVQIVKEGESFSPWEKTHCEYDLKSSVAIEARNKLSNHVQQKAA